MHDYIISTVCSGIGSPEQGCAEIEQEDGITHKIGFYCEIDKYARTSYEANFDGGFMVPDMTKEQWTGPEYYSDLFIGGIPCQAFSLAGLRKGELDPRGLLFYDYYRYVKTQNPKAFIIENVKGLLSDSNGKTFQNWLHLLGQSINGHMQMFNHPDSLPYNLHWTVLNSKDFGVPQNRERVFIVGIRNDQPNIFRFPAAIKLTKKLKDILEVEVDEKYYLSDKAIQSIINNTNNIQQSYVNPEIADRLQSPGNACGTYKGANYISDVSTILRWQNSTDGVVEDSISPTLRATKGNDGIRKQPCVLERIPVIEVAGNLPIVNDMRSRVYSTAGISPTLTSNTGGGHQPKIVIEDKGPNPQVLQSKRTEFGKKVRKDYEAGNVKLQRNEITELTPRADGIRNTISTVTKDNLIVEPNPTLIEHRGHLNKEPTIITDGIVPTLRAQSHGHETKVVTNYRIRRLTPLECFRLQGFPDSFYYKCKFENKELSKQILAKFPNHKGKRIMSEGERIERMSDSQLYKQAGNTITTKVIKAIIRNVLKVIVNK